jgi:hypothetical protein
MKYKMLYFTLQWISRNYCGIEAHVASMRNAYKILVGKPEEDNLENLGIGGRIILE